MEDKFLKVLGRASSETIGMLWDHKESDILPEKSVNFWIDFSKYTIKSGSIFNRLIFNESEINIDGKLKFITDSSLMALDFIDEGYKTLVIIQFKELPAIIEHIPIIKNWYDHDESNPQVYLVVESEDNPNNNSLE